MIRCRSILRNIRKGMNFVFDQQNNGSYFTTYNTTEAGKPFVRRFTRFHLLYRQTLPILYVLLNLCPIQCGANAKDCATEFELCWRFKLSRYIHANSL